MNPKGSEYHPGSPSNPKMTTGLNFMKTPLVTWVQTFQTESLTYQDLTDGVYLNKVMREIDSRSVVDSVISNVEEPKDRIVNWDILIKNIKAYYQDVLQQLIVMKLPNIIILGKEPESDAAHSEIEKTLLLLLGCSIQCEQQETFIETIKLLDVDVQQAIVECIKEVTDESKNVFAIDPDADLTDSSRNMLDHMRRLISERDGLLGDIKTLNGALDELHAEHQQLQAVSLHAQKTVAAAPGAPASGSSPEKHHGAIELAECKAKLRRLRQELEDKSELLIELQEEVEECRETATKLRAENLELTQDARSARALRDEVDILKDKASRLDKAETEITKYKEKLNELEYYKTRVDEIREDNAILVETRNMLEEQLASCHKRIEAVIEVEQDLISYKERVSQLQEERDTDRQKIQDLVEEKSRLEIEKQSSLSESANLEEQLTKTKIQLHRGVTNSLDDQLKETANAKVLRLELQNQKLQQQVEELQENSRLNRLKELEIENKKLNESLEKTSSEAAKMEREMKKLQKAEEFVQELENSHQTAEEENKELRKTVTALKMACDKYEEIDVEKSHLEVEYRKLSRTVESLQKSVAKGEAMEKENINLKVELHHSKRLADNAKDSSSKLAELEHDNDSLNYEIQQLKKALSVQKEDRSKLEQLELELMDLDTENQKLQRNLEAATRRAESFEQENQELENQASELAKSVDGMRLNLRKFEEKEKNFLHLEQENSSLHREKNNLEKENKRLKQNYEIKDSAVDELSTKLGALERQNRNLFKEIERNQDLEDRLTDFERDNLEIIQQAKLDKKTLATLREDLVNEKIRTQQLSNEREKLKVELDKIGLNTEKLVAVDNTDGENKYRLLESMMNDAHSKSLSIKEERIHALETRLRESMQRNSSLQEQIKDVRSNYEALQQCREEDIMLQSAPSRTRSQSHGNNPPSTRDLLELKDHLIMVERKNASLETEKESLQKQVTSLQDQASQMRTQANKVQSQSSSVASQNASLQSQLAKIQVENTTLTAQVNSLQAQNASLQKERGQLDARRQQLEKAQEHLISTHDGLMSDHEQLQKLHEQLSTEFEALISEHGSLKANHKAAKSELKELQDKRAMMSHEKDTIAQLKQVLLQDKQSDSRSHNNLQMDILQLKEDNMKLVSVNERIQREYRDLLSEEKTYKTEYNQLKLRNSELQSSLSRCKDQLRNSEVELSRMASKCEYISQLNVKLEEDNRALLMQVQALLTQNQELLTQSLESKDLLAEEQKTNLERVADLNRQKERLEEKIMDQYKRYDPIKKKNKSFGSNFVKRAKQMLSTEAKQRSRSKERFRDDSIEGSIFANDPYGNQDKNGRKMKRRGSVDNVLDEVKPNNDLAGQSRAFAHSTTALHMLDIQHGGSSFAMRGAKSSEQLDSDGNAEWPTTRGRRRTLLNNTANHHDISNLSRDSDEGRKKTFSTSTDIDDLDGEDFGEISLDQFLSECDRSPKSRRKFLVDKRIDLEDASESVVKSDESKTKALGPDLGPRAPTVDEAEAEQEANMSRRCKSEMNISQFSKMSLSKQDNRLNLVSEDRLFSTTPRKTSDHGPGFSDRHRTKSVGEFLGQPPPHKVNGTLDDGKASLSSNSSDSAFSRVPPSPAARAFQPYTANQSAHSIPRQNSSGSSSRSSSSANIGAYNAMTRQTTAGPNPQMMPRPMSVADVPYNNSSPQRHLPSRPVDIDPYAATNRNDRYTPVHGMNRPSQFPPPPPEYSDIPKGHTPPVPPPRRSRPMSAGPLRSSSNSAFSVPPQRSPPDHVSPRDSRATSMPPEQDHPETVRPKIMSRPESNLGRSSSGRTLPQPPVERMVRPGSTPPKPSKEGSTAPPKSSVWHMYSNF